MKTTWLFIFLFSTVLFMSGCVYVNTVNPGRVQTGTQFELKSGDYKVIQRVNALGEAAFWFGLVTVGGKGYQALWRKQSE